MLTTGYQLAAARALVGMDQTDIAHMAEFSVTTIRNMERAGAGQIAGRHANVQAVQRALEASGVEFANHGQPGVRLWNAQMATLRLIAARAARLADITAWDTSKPVSDQERDERRDKVRTVGAGISKLADAARGRTVSYSEFKILLDELHALGWFPANEMVAAVADACLQAERSAALIQR